ncbi:MAG: pimeloyl-CoA dehydrogenase large subunit [Gammaproteobacteria bacterium]|nr:MAG: pimeloyl-CoA dehydrogenase large subunit [Gammaproteobacteria bacterium]
MDLNFSDADLAFREEVREFLRNEYPADIREKMDRGIRLARDDFMRWQQTLHARGWAAPNWPVEHGGTGWSATQKYIFTTELALANTPTIMPFGLSMVGPVIYTYGNEEQKARFLPDILASRAWWCQGYSEPGAGSDLASLKTRAERDGDHYVINGTKTWTTLGQFADWIFLLARTSTDVSRKQEGISFILADMRTPGISLRPIITIDGEHEVNEVHFENVRVPVENLVGEEGRGWTYGKVLLQHERAGIAAVARSKYRLDTLKRLAAEAPPGGTPLMDDPVFRRKVAAVEIELLALEYTDLRTLAAVATGGAPGPESSILKIKGTEVQQAIDELYVEAAGCYAFAFTPELFASPDIPDATRIGPPWAADTAPHYFNGRKVSIYGGTNEIQKNIIAKAVLGL